MIYINIRFIIQRVRAHTHTQYLRNCNVRLRSHLLRIKYYITVDVMYDDMIHFLINEDLRAYVEHNGLRME